MKNLEIKIGKTEKEIKSLYLGAIDTMVAFGYTEKEARKIVQETFKDTLKSI